MKQIWNERPLSKNSKLNVETVGLIHSVNRITVVGGKTYPCRLFTTKDIREAFKYFEDYYKLNYEMEEASGRV